MKVSPPCFFFFQMFSKRTTMRSAAFYFFNLLFLLFNLYLITYNSADDQASVQPISHPSGRSRNDHALKPQPQGILDEVDAPPPDKPIVKKDYSKMRESYRVETFRTTNLVNCKAILAGKVGVWFRIT